VRRARRDVGLGNINRQNLEITLKASHTSDRLDRRGLLKSGALAWLGVVKSHSRPHVSNDNPFAESQFKTLKYRPEFPDRFSSFAQAHAFCGRFFPWYNDEHYHSGLGLLTPAMVHFDRTDQVLAVRQRALLAAYEAHPERFVRQTPKPKAPPHEVWINPPSVNGEEEPVIIRSATRRYTNFQWQVSQNH
jgi:putative transposase